jgi:AhpD family alkylhydroperoxidase
MRPFRKRHYHGLIAAWRDLRSLARQRVVLKEAMRGRLVSPAMRERLMLTVTQVNGCVYCSRFHARLALRAGVTQDELTALLAGSLPPESPTDEAVAVAYAQHWAESDGQPDSHAQQRLTAVYGQEKADAIHSLLRLIRAGNLAGNTWDYLLYRLSFGRLGQ